MESILLSIKKLLGIEEDYHHFDPDIIMAINSAFSTLHQLGVGTESSFSITGDAEKWSDFIRPGYIETVKYYVYFKVRIMFDPPSNSFLLESINRQIDELTWRMLVMTETDDEE